MNLFARSLACLAVVALVFVSAAHAVAQDPVPSTFSVCVRHNINGRSLGASKDFPVIAEVTSTEGVDADIPLSFTDTFCADLPAGEYTIRVFSLDLGAEVPTMTVGPVMIPAGADLFILARLSGGKTPILDVKVKD